MDNRSAVQSFWRATRDGLARLNQILAEADTAEDAVFQTPPRGSGRTADAERRIAKAREARREDRRT